MTPSVGLARREGRRPHHARRSWLIIGALWVGVYLYAGDEAPRNAQVEGVSIAGLAPAAAEKKLRAELESRTDDPISVSYGDGRIVTVNPRKAGLSIDYPASIEEAGGGSGFGPGACGSSSPEAVTTTRRSPSTSPRCRRSSTT